MEKQDIKTNPNLVDALGYYIKNSRLQKKIGLREMADKLNTIPYEILTGVSRRVKRVYFSE